MGLGVTQRHNLTNDEAIVKRNLRKTTSRYCVNIAAWHRLLIAYLIYELGVVLYFIDFTFKILCSNFHGNNKIIIIFIFATQLLLMMDLTAVLTAKNFNATKLELQVE